MHAHSEFALCCPRRTAATALLGNRVTRCSCARLLVVPRPPPPCFPAAMPDAPLCALCPSATHTGRSNGHGLAGRGVGERVPSDDAAAGRSWQHEGVCRCSAAAAPYAAGHHHRHHGGSGSGRGAQAGWRRPSVLAGLCAPAAQLPSGAGGARRLHRWRPAERHPRLLQRAPREAR
jgi:hypothetical protein